MYKFDFIKGTVTAEEPSNMDFTHPRLGLYQVPNTEDAGQGAVSRELLMFKVRHLTELPPGQRTARTDEISAVEGEDWGGVMTIVGWIVRADVTFTHIACCKGDDEVFLGGVVVPNSAIMDTIRLVEQ